MCTTNFIRFKLSFKLEIFPVLVYDKLNVVNSKIVPLQQILIFLNVIQINNLLVILTFFGLIGLKKLFSFE